MGNDGTITRPTCDDTMIYRRCGRSGLMLLAGSHWGCGTTSAVWTPFGWPADELGSRQTWDWQTWLFPGDAAVAAAYGWPADLPDEEILARLLALNLERISK